MESLQGCLATRRLQLQASVELYQFYHLSTMELTWIAEHMPSASSASSTTCLDDALSLCHKHKVMAPFSSQDPNALFPGLGSSLLLLRVASFPSLCPQLFSAWELFHIWGPEPHP